MVLGYISNEARRFHVYVANRVQQIRAHSNTSQWKYVNSSQNPVDIASRGLNAGELANNSVWLKGPEFLWKQDVSITEPETFMVDPRDPEVKGIQSLSCSTESSEPFSLLEHLEYFSSWHLARRAEALCQRFIAKLRQRVSEKIQAGDFRIFKERQL